MYYCLQQISPVPPPVPARLNKAPAIPERKSIKKPDDTPASTVTADISSASETSTSSTITVKLPPPPQSTSKRGSFSRQVVTEPKEAVENCDHAKPNTQRTDTQHKAPQNSNFPEIKTLTPLQNAALFNNLQNKSTDEGYFKFPRVQTPPNSNSEETFSSVRRKSGKKIPPPIHTYTNQVIDETESPNFGSISKMSVRHDSTLSCSDGGISQTSSPSYLVRSLESPLLPKVKTHSTNRHSKRKFITDKLFSDINEFAMPKDNKNLSPPDLTKSQSTPGGLQTVVDYQQGANLPYQHKVRIF